MRGWHRTSSPDAPGHRLTRTLAGGESLFFSAAAAAAGGAGGGAAAAAASRRLDRPLAGAGAVPGAPLPRAAPRRRSSRGRQTPAARAPPLAVPALTHTAPRRPRTCAPAPDHGGLSVERVFKLAGDHCEHAYAALRVTTHGQCAAQLLWGAEPDTLLASTSSNAIGAAAAHVEAGGLWRRRGPPAARSLETAARAQGCAASRRRPAASPRSTPPASPAAPPPQACSTCAR
jgi:hypothetical protein